MKKIGYLTVGLMLLTSCMREPESSELAKYLVVQTEYNQDFIKPGENIFHTYSTFVMVDDKMGFVSTRFPNVEFLTQSDYDFVIPVLNAVRDGFTSEGFEKVTEEDDPDFAVNVVVLQDFNFFQTINYGYGYYPGSYYGYYGYYFPYVSTYYANYVTLLVQVVDAKSPNSNNEYPIIWSAYIGDLNYTLDRKTSMIEAVEQAFKQSPYLTKN
jgi:hypothetical protein